MLLVMAPLAIRAAAEEPALVRASPLPGARADVASLLMGGSDGGVLPVAAVAHPGKLGDEPTVELWLEVDGSVLVPPAEAGGEAPAKSETLDIYGYLLDGRPGARGDLLGSLARRVRLPTEDPAVLDRMQGSGIRMAFPLPVPETGRRGDTRLEVRLMVRHRRTDYFALRVLEVTVPASGDAPSVRWPEPATEAAEWLRVYDGAASSEELARALVSRADPPSAWPVLIADQLRPITLEGASEIRSARLYVGGDEKNALDIAIEKTATGGLGLRLPDVPTGAHLVELVPDSRKKSARVRRSVLVLGSDWTFDSGSELPPWTWVRRVAADPSAAEKKAEAEARSAEMAEARRKSERVAVLAEAYRAVLDRLASGDLDGAIEDLLRLESQTLEGAKRRDKARQWLQAAQTRVAAAVAEESPEALLPLIALHLGAHETLQANGSTDVNALELCWSRLEALSSTYAEAVDRPLAAGLAASALARVSLDVDRAGMPRAGRKLLDAAAALSAEDPDVLLLLGYWHERRGDYERAIVVLDRLIQVRPDHEEGRLRLATCLRRSGQLAAATTHLRRLARGAREPWVAVLAKGELGRALVDAGRTEEAVAALERAVMEHPEHPRLRLQLGYALDRFGQRTRARETLAALEAAPAAISPRLRYGDRPEPSADGGGRAELRRHARARLPVLITSLHASDRAGDGRR